MAATKADPIAARATAGWATLRQACLAGVRPDLLADCAPTEPRFAFRPQIQFRLQIQNVGIGEAGVVDVARSHRTRTVVPCPARSGDIDAALGGTLARAAHVQAYRMPGGWRLMSGFGENGMSGP